VLILSRYFASSHTVGWNVSRIAQAFLLAVALFSTTAVSLPDKAEAFSCETNPASALSWPKPYTDPCAVYDERVITWDTFASVFNECKTTAVEKLPEAASIVGRWAIVAAVASIYPAYESYIGMVVASELWDLGKKHLPRCILRGLLQGQDWSEKNERLAVAVTNAFFESLDYRKFAKDMIGFRDYYEKFGRLPKSKFNKALIKADITLKKRYYKSATSIYADALGEVGSLLHGIFRGSVSVAKSKYASAINAFRDCDLLETDRRLVDLANYLKDVIMGRREYINKMEAQMKCMSYTPHLPIAKLGIPVPSDIKEARDYTKQAERILRQAGIVCTVLPKRDEEQIRVNQAILRTLQKANSLMQSPACDLEAANRSLLNAFRQAKDSCTSDVSLHAIKEAEKKRNDIYRKIASIKKWMEEDYNNAKQAMKEKQSCNVVDEYIDNIQKMLESEQCMKGFWGLEELQEAVKSARDFEGLYEKFESAVERCDKTAASQYLSRIRNLRCTPDGVSPEILKAKLTIDLKHCAGEKPEEKTEKTIWCRCYWKDGWKAPFPAPPSTKDYKLTRMPESQADLCAATVGNIKYYASCTKSYDAKGLQPYP